TTGATRAAGTTGTARSSRTLTGASDRCAVGHHARVRAWTAGAWTAGTCGSRTAALWTRHSLTGGKGVVARTGSRWGVATLVGLATLAATSGHALARRKRVVAGPGRSGAGCRARGVATTTTLACRRRLGRHSRRSVENRTGRCREWGRGSHRGSRGRRRNGRHNGWRLGNGHTSRSR